MSNDALTSPKSFAMTQPALAGGTTSALAGTLAGLTTPPGNGSLLDSGAGRKYRFVSSFWCATTPVVGSL
jgi:hypothetical protein